MKEISETRVTEAERIQLAQNRFFRDLVGQSRSKHPPTEPVDPITIQDQLDGLSHLEKGVVNAFYGLEDGDSKDRGRVARELGLNTDRVEQIRRHAIQTLRHTARLGYLLT